jgi:hypothetical protein
MDTDPHDILPQAKPNFLWSLVTMKCPRCRRGPMFENPSPWNLKKMMKMPVACPVCGQIYELEVGFWYGTGYVSYVLTVLFSVLSFAGWFLTIGFSLSDNRFFWWLGANAVVLLFLQPWFMRLSRVIYLYIFVPYDPYYPQNEITTFDYDTNAYFKADKKSQDRDPG